MRNAGSVKPGGKALSQLETLVLRFLCTHGPVTSEQVREGLADKHPMKDATVRTILRRLEVKGYATHDVAGRTYIYRGLERPENVGVNAVRQLLDRFWGGSVERLLVGMVDQQVISPRDLTELAEKIRERQKKGS
jgi:BlaI family transcriptional regulator, penicillinase repressor